MVVAPGPRDRAEGRMSREALRTRARAALLVALVSAAYAGVRAWHEPRWPTDFDQLWHAAMAWRSGGEPYAAVGPGRAFRWDWSLYYPLPAVFLALPFTLVPVAVARVLFSALSGAALGLALGPRLRTHWPLLLSASFLIATSRTQWAPLLLAVLWLPGLGVVLAAKPNLGIAILAALRGRALVTAVLGAAAITLVCTVLRPDWISAWRSAIADAPHVVAPAAARGGFLLLLAGLRWRRADARLLLGLSLVPHTPSLYDLLPLFFLARTRVEALGLALLTHILWWGFIAFSGGPTFDTYAASLGNASILGVYLPCLAAVLLRPNIAEEVLPDAPAHGRREMLLLAPLLAGAAMLVYLPLVTRR